MNSGQKWLEMNSAVRCGFVARTNRKCRNHRLVNKNKTGEQSTSGNVVERLNQDHSAVAQTIES